MKYIDHYISHCTVSKQTPDKKFIEWINKIEDFVENVTELKLLELPDEDYMNEFEKGTSWQVYDYAIVNDFFSQ